MSTENTNGDEQSNSDFGRWSDLVGALASYRVEHRQLLANCLPDGGFPENGKRLLVIAALRRSDSLLQAFVSLVDAQNRFSAIPLIRMQLDSAMRVHACSIVPDSDSFVKHVLKGGEPRKYPFKPQLSDSYLHGLLTHSYPHTTDLYRETNGYVHLSNHHLFGVFDWKGLQRGEFALTDTEALHSWPEELRKSDVVSMLWATEVLTEECKSLVAGDEK